jgi:hypothetical protein
VGAEDEECVEEGSDTDTLDTHVETEFIALEEVTPHREGATVGTGTVVTLF